jgi:hypothetical protein
VLACLAVLAAARVGAAPDLRGVDSRPSPGWLARAREEVVALLDVATDNARPVVDRARAIRVLATVESNTAMVDRALRSLLTDRAGEVRVQAAGALLERARTSSALRGVARGLLHHPDTHLRMFVVRVLALRCATDLLARHRVQEQHNDVVVALDVALRRAAGSGACVAGERPLPEVQAGPR